MDFHKEMRQRKNGANNPSLNLSWFNWYAVDKIVAHSLLAASEADTLNMGIEAIMKRSS
jgi:hypothetical protein